MYCVNLTDGDGSYHTMAVIYFPQIKSRYHPLSTLRIHYKSNTLLSWISDKWPSIFTVDTNHSKSTEAFIRSFEITIRFKNHFNI